MVLQYWNAHGADGCAKGNAFIQNQLYSRKVRGISASDMEGYLKVSGFRVFFSTESGKTL
jgi:hypothetical protein